MPRPGGTIVYCNDSEALLTTLKIEAHAAERLITRILREDGKLAPADAIKLAAKLCGGISAAMPDLLRAGYNDGWRAIKRSPPRGDVMEMVTKMRRNLPQADEETLDDVWRIIYEYGHEVPDSVLLDIR